jgi:GT2 family glycosyltransferase
MRSAKPETSSGLRQAPEEQALAPSATSEAATDDLAEQPNANLVVPFAGTEEDLEGLLTHLDRLHLGDGDSVTVVDNRPTGKVPRWDEPQRSVIAARNRQSSYYARNCGAANGDAEWLVFIDADVMAPPDLTTTYLDPPADDWVGVLVGAVDDERPPAGNGHAVPRFLFQKASMSQSNTLRDMWSYAQTANCAVRRIAFERVGGFRDDIRSGGDADLCFRLREAGWSLESRPSARVVHRTRTTVRALVRQRARHGSGSAWLNEVYPGSFPSRLRPGLVSWSVRQLALAARQLMRGERDRAALSLLDPLSSWAFEIGRFIPNRVPEPANSRQGGSR